MKIQKNIPLFTILNLILLAGLIACSTRNNPISTSTFDKAINGSHRSQESRDRDRYRHPQQTLEFFGLTEGMTVVEIWPGRKGWYTEVLAPILKDRGKLYAAHFSADSDIAFFTSSLERFQAKMLENPDVYGKVILTTLQPPSEINIAPNGSADRIFTFRNVHNWMKSGQAETVFQAMYDALKPGGVLGIVEHRGIAGKPQDPNALSGYVTEKYVIELAESAGFEFLSRSEINANPKDDKVHPAGVWSLPPSLRLGDKDKDKYQSIGESDRMTLKFRKPQ